MKNVTATTVSTKGIFDGDWELRMFPVLRLAPGFKLDLSFLRESPAFLERASPLPATKAIRKYHQ
ncbi:MAG: hypothetical protein LBB26_00465 [Puniceicoccales bacterium]|jgi:hypothetical protein|nr:hypothetical protein [Puniceicoccales bacterium]